MTKTRKEQPPRDRWIRIVMGAIEAVNVHIELHTTCSKNCVRLKELMDAQHQISKEASTALGFDSLDKQKGYPCRRNSENGSAICALKCKSGNQAVSILTGNLTVSRSE